MHSNDLPITEWWDPQWDIYDVPLSPDLDDPDAPDHDTWWAAYEHLWMLRHIMTGQAEYVPSHFQHQLTTGAENCGYSVAPGPPIPCCCPYAQHVARMALPAKPGQRRVERILYVAATYFLINPRCIHHGEPRREWALLPWETTLGPDETQP